MESNPYTSPSSNLFGGTGGTGAEAVTQGTISQLQRTRPWVMFMSIMAFIGAAFMIGMGGLMLVAGAVGASTSGSGMGGAEVTVIAVMAGFYGILGFMYIYPGVKMWKYASRIADLARNRATVDLEAALNEQRVLWKYSGIMVIISIVLTIVMMVALAATGMSQMSNLRGL